MCLKLYCECFAAGRVCLRPCNCPSCLNNEEHADVREEAMRVIKERNPVAFDSKIEKSALGKAQDDSLIRHKKGCHCSRSGCQKKYCECFQNGVVCSDLCKCNDCKNHGDPDHHHKHESEKKA